MAKLHSRDPPSAYAKYAECMEEIKRRGEVIWGFLNGRCSAMYEQTTAESVCLQLRKILELIALASLAANKEEYERHRKGFHADWNATKILASLEKVNPAFYPTPTRQVIDEVTGTVVGAVTVESGYLTKSEYKILYRKCGEILHARNPFSQREQDIGSFLEKVPEWMEKVRVLLNDHEVQLVNPERHLRVVMKAESDGKVHVMEMEEIGGAKARWLDAMDPKTRAQEIGRMNAANRANRGVGSE